MSFLSPVFYINSIHIGTISEAACFNLGNNFPTDFSSVKRQNQGFGSISGDHNDIRDIRTLLKDSSFIDMLTEMEQKKLPPWLSELVALKFQEESAGDGYDGPCE